MYSQMDVAPQSARQGAPPITRPRPVLPVRPSPAPPAPSPAYYTPPQSLSKADTDESHCEDVTSRLGTVNIEDFLPVRTYV